MIAETIGWVGKQVWLVASLLFLGYATSAQESVELAVGKADAVVDLRNDDGVAAVKGIWIVTNANLVQRAFRAPGPDGTDPLRLYPTGMHVNTYDLSPRAGSIAFDDAQWKHILASDLETRQGTGLLSFVWFRLSFEVPQKLGTFETAGSRIVFELVMDDYSEIWINGMLSKQQGTSGGGVVSGWNARNRVVLTERAIPGERIQIAILGINGPLSDAPENYIWVRSATLDFYRQKPVPAGWENVGEVIKIDDSLDEIIAKEASVDRLATGFQFTEGPVWHPEGFLLFSDPNTNVIYSYTPLTGNVEIFRTKSGYSGFDIGEYHQPGSNGLALDREGRLTICEHGNRRVVKLEKKGPLTVLADTFEGKRLNSPNDLVYRSDGMLYFTDPPYGLPQTFNDRRKQLGHSGVYAIHNNGNVVQVAGDLKGPNGIAFSPDEKYLYVSNWDITDIHHTKVIMRYAVKSDGSLSNGIQFFNMNQTDGEIALDGIKVDVEGNLFCAGPGGIWIISPEGKYLGRIITPEHAANMAWGDDGHSLYITASSSLYRVRVKTGGSNFLRAPRIHQ